MGSSSSRRCVKTLIKTTSRRSAWESTKMRNWDGSQRDTHDPYVDDYRGTD
jgi:hypothetical protein